MTFYNFRDIVSKLDKVQLNLDEVSNYVQIVQTACMQLARRVRIEMGKGVMVPNLAQRSHWHPPGVGMRWARWIDGSSPAAEQLHRYLCLCLLQEVAGHPQSPAFPTASCIDK